MPADSDEGSARPRPMRADARRNRAQILRAARELFADKGPDVPLDDIARKAGVGVATLYRRFPERDDLVRGVAFDVFAGLTEAARDAAERHTDPLDALRSFMHAGLDLKAGAVMPALAGRIPADEALDAAGRAAALPVQDLLSRAHAAGSVRPGTAFGDIALAVARFSRPVPVLPRSVDDALAHRHLDLYIDGLRPPGSGVADPVPSGPPVDLDWFDEIRRSGFAGGAADVSAAAPVGPGAVSGDPPAPGTGGRTDGGTKSRTGGGREDGRPGGTSGTGGPDRCRL